MGSSEWITNPYDRDATLNPGATAASRVRVSVVRGCDKGLVLESEGPSIRVGTRADNEMVLTDASVSRNHLTVERRGSAWYLRDADSRNGTYIGGLRIHETRLERGLSVGIGESLLAIDLVRVEAQADVVERLMGRSAAMRELRRAIERVAPTDVGVLLVGETGTGKSAVAHAIHAASRRASAFIVSLDGASLAIPLADVASSQEALSAGVEKIERAHGGTLFIEELADLPLALQTRLTDAIPRFAGDRSCVEGLPALDVRIIAATAFNPEALVASGRLSRELHARVATMILALPPLRARTEDLPCLVDSFFAWHAEELEAVRSPARRLSPEALGVLAERRFPGNVRELFNVLWQSAVVARSEVVEACELSDEGGRSWRRSPERARRETEAWSGDYKAKRARVLDVFERAFVSELISRYENNVSRAAREAGIGRRHLHRLLEKHGVYGGHT